MITNLLTLHNQLKVFHWQTKSYASHQAYGDTYNILTDLIDEFVEVFMGKYGKIKNEDGFNVNLVNLKDNNQETSFIDEQIKYLSSDLRNKLKEEDTDLLNILDEMLSNLNKLKYLLTLS